MTTTLAISSPNRSMPLAPRSRTGDSHGSSILPLVELMSEMSQVVEGLTNEQFTRKPVGQFSGSIGGHVRHCLDHVLALIGAANSGCLCYDHRDRGTAVETDRCAALEAIDRTILALTALHVHPFDRQLALSAAISAEGQTVEVHTTLGREVVYVLSHTIHHNAMIGAMVKTLGGHTPPRFGYAPSTLIHLRQAPCAP